MLVWLERIAWIVGLVLLAIYAGARASSERARLEGIATMDEVRETLIDERLKTTSSPHTPDTSLWSPSRIDAWRHASNAQDRPQAVLSIASVELRVPVFEGTSEKNLNRGAGRIEGTAPIGDPGNVGLAAHRDGYFRALKDVRIGDRVQLMTTRDVLTYRIVATTVVDPTAVEVLAPTSTQMLTLVTCYPFYYVGSAPQRFIVRAELIQDDPLHERESEAPTSNLQPPAASRQPKQRPSGCESISKLAGRRRRGAMRHEHTCASYVAASVTITRTVRRLADGR